MRRRRIIGAGIAAVLVAALGSSVTPTSANWTTQEWDAARVGTLDCDASGTYLSRAQGRLLSGGLLPLDLDTVATVGGVTVTNDATTSHPDPTTATALGGDAYANPLDVAALGLVNLPLTGTKLADILTIPLDSDVGLLNQYARASSDGVSTGAAGVVNDSGVVDTSNDPATGAPPELGTLHLSRLVSALTGRAVGDLVAGLADLRLEIGAVAGRASLDACAADWEKDLDANLTRSYAIAGLDATIESPMVSDVVITTDGATASIEGLLDGLASDGGVTTALAGALNAIVAPLLASPLGLGQATVVGPTVTADFSAVQVLLTDDISDAGQVVRIDLDGGTISVDLAALLGEAYGGTGFNGTQALGLNGLPANTELLLDDAVVNALSAAVTSALDDWVADVVAAVEKALYAATVDLVLSVKLTALMADVAEIRVPIQGASLRSLLDGTAVIAPTMDLGLVNTLCQIPVAGVPFCAVKATLEGLTAGILGAITTRIGPAVGAIIESAIFAPTGPVGTLGGTLSAATAPVVTLLADVLVGFFGVDGLVSLRANVQNDAAAGNDPDPTTAPYADWESGTLLVPAGRYDVAALGVGVLDVGGPGSNVNLELGRGSVGANCALTAPGPCVG